MDPRVPPSLFQPYLMPHERILWTGRPKQGPVLRPSDALLVPFSLFIASFALVWNSIVWAAGGPLLFKLVGLLVLLYALYAVAGRFLVDAIVRGRTAYALTDRRIVTLSGLHGQTVSSLDLRQLPRLTLNQRRDGSGTITFDEDIEGFFGRYWGVTLNLSMWTPSLVSPSQLFRIRDARKVHDLIIARAEAAA